MPLGHFIYYNDPYECNIGSLDYEKICSISDNISENKEYLSDIIQRMANEEKWDFSYTESVIKMGASFGAKYLAPINLLAAIVVFGGGYLFANIAKKEKTPKISIDSLSEFFTKVIEELSHTYTSCFTTEKDTFLMWSHYADSHKGVVIGFDTDYAPFKDNPPLSIDYSKEHFVFSSESIVNNDITGAVKKILLRKNKEWEKEKEHRFIFDAKTKKEEVIWHDHYDNPVVSLDNKAIKSICFGYRVSTGKIDSIKKILTDMGLMNNVELFKCILSKEKYSIETVLV